MGSSFCQVGALCGPSTLAPLSACLYSTLVWGRVAVCVSVPGHFRILHLALHYSVCAFRTLMTVTLGREVFRNVILFEMLLLERISSESH